NASTSRSRALCCAVTVHQVPGIALCLPNSENAYQKRQTHGRRGYVTARRHWRCQIFPFAVVGVIGFAIDAGVLTILVSALGLSPYQARAISFTLAVLGTWLVNRRWTFRSSQPVRQSVGIEYIRYLFVQALGAASNLCVFAFALARYPELIRYPVIP